MLMNSQSHTMGDANLHYIRHTQSLRVIRNKATQNKYYKITQLFYVLYSRDSRQKAIITKLLAISQTLQSYKQCSQCYSISM